jgi:hypothetical protein
MTALRYPIIISRFQRWESFKVDQPGPMAQAFTFRAFGAKTISIL